MILILFLALHWAGVVFIMSRSNIPQIFVSLQVTECSLWLNLRALSEACLHSHKFEKYIFV